MNANKQEIFIEPIDVGTMYLSPDEKQEITHIHIKLSKPFPKKEEAKKLVNRWLSQPALLDACETAEHWLIANVPAVNRPASLDKLLMDAIALAKKP